jgi:hypothetical protein
MLRLAPEKKTPAFPLPRPSWQLPSRATVERRRLRLAMEAPAPPSSSVMLLPGSQRMAISKRKDGSHRFVGEPRLQCFLPATAAGEPRAIRATVSAVAAATRSWNKFVLRVWLQAL